MLRRRDFIERLQAAGVRLETSEHEYLTDDGERARTQFLIRIVDGKPMYYVVEFDHLDDPVPKYLPRRIAIKLDLPPDVFILPDDPL